ncbi:hypothetical protein EDB80DRAFT_761663 [Ilyonectria destructans]|nr:hypothetical protein EDB80DRAFT_761663 [Ilyonectria destructans]
MAEPIDIRGTKRANTQRGSDSGKRRAPYALRACDACRRRKGKCDGRHPCGHCAGRGQNCNFSNGTGPGDWTDIPASASDADQVNSHQLDEQGNPAMSSAGGGSILELVSSLKDQLDSLTSRVQLSNNQPMVPNIPSTMSLPGGFQSQSPERIDPGSGRETAGSDGQPHRQASQRFYGPTSPDYSLNMAQMKIREGSSSTSPSQRPQLASIEDEEASDDDSGIAGVDGGGRSKDPLPPRNRRDNLQLQRFRSLMNLQEAARLLFVYQEVVGEYHPMVNLDDLMCKTRVWYTGEAPAHSDPRDYSPRRPVPGSDENDLLILNLALAIALRAESTLSSGNSDIEGILQSSFQDIVNAKVVSPASSIKDVKIILLAALYFFFQDMTRSAWRMCGIAGRVLMELGFHNGDVSRHVLDSEAERTETSIIMCSVVTLDRQWSASTGLPSNFQHSSFEPLPKSSIKNPYLKAMLAFILISDKFNEPISCAARGERYEDQDAFDVMNFQVEQWRKKAVGNQSLSNFGTWHSNPSARPPSWAIILHLRADSIRSYLLRPGFFAASEVETGREQLRPALDLVSHMVNVLFTLDTTTDIYRMQHPYYQHLLASACALFFLLVAYVKQNHASLASSLSVDFVDSVSQIFRMTLTVSGRYANTSRASRRLWKRLSEMRGTLVTLNLLSDNLPDMNNHFPRIHLGEPEPSMPHAVKYVQNTSALRSNWKGRFTGQGSNFLPPVDGNISNPFSTAMGAIPENDLQLGWSESLLSNWPMGDENIFFAEGPF